jgi:dihydroorotate dehydrogenase (NAD+) catalytic subunit
MKSLLNIQIEMNTLGKNEPVILAKAFYHWSSCTLTAFQLVNKIVDSEIYSTDISDPVEKAIRLLESTGAGLAATEFSEKYDEKNYNKSTSENAGVIIISEKGLQVEQDWEELIVSINISTGVIDMGGIMNATDAIEFMLAGASAIQVGTANFVDPTVSVKIVDGINEYLDRHGFESVKDIIGALEI